MKLRTVVVVFLIAVLAAAGYAGLKLALQRRALAWRRDSDAAASSGDFRRAADLLVPYLRRYPQDTSALRRYVKFREQGELPNAQNLYDAIGALKLLLVYDPDSVDDRRHLLELYVKVDRWPEALDDARALLRTHPNDVRTLQLESEVLQRLGRDREALDVVEKWSEVAPLEVAAHLMRLDIRSRLYQPAQTIVADAERLLSRHPGDPRFELVMAAAYGNTGDEKQAERWLRSAAARPGLDFALTRLLVEQFDKLGLAGPAMACLERQVRTKGDPESRHMLGCRYFELGRWPDAAECFTDVNPQGGNSETSLLALRAISLANLGDTADAQRCRDGLSRRQSTTARAWTLVLGLPAHAPDGELRQAVTTCDVATSVDSADGYLLYYQGDAAARLGEEQLALEAWHRVLASNKSWALPAVSVSEMLLRQGHPGRAIPFAVTAVRRNPTAVPVILLARAWAAAIDAGGTNRPEELAALVREVQRRIPDEPQTLLIDLELSALRGERQEALRTGRRVLAHTPPFEETVLLAVASVSQRFKLGLEEEAFAASEKAHGITAPLCYARALVLLAGAHPREGLRLLKDASSHASAATRQSWELALAKYGEWAGEPDAKAAWARLSDHFPEDQAVQRQVLSAPSVAGDRRLMQTVIDRLRSITGPSGLGWRLAQAALLVDFSGGEGDLDRGALLLNDLVRTHPSLAEPRVLLARALLRMRQRDGAISQLSTAATLVPDDAAVGLQLAELLQERGDTDRAMQIVDRVAPVLGTPAGRRRAAAVLTAMGRTDRAIQILEAEAGTASAGNDLLLATLYRRKGDLKKAEEVVQRILAHPDTQGIAFAARYYALQGRPAEAQHALSLLDSFSSAPGERELVLGDYCLQSGRFDAAVAHYERATVQSPKSRRAWRALILAKAISAPPSSYLSAVDRALAAIPGDETFTAIKSQSALLLDASQEPSLRPAVLAFLRDPIGGGIALRIMRLVCDGIHDPDNALLVTRLQNLAEQSPDSLLAQLALINAYIAAGQSTDALLVAQRSMSSFPASAEPARVAAEIAASSGRWADMFTAAQAWRRRSVDDWEQADLAIARAQIGMRQYESAVATLAPYVSAAADGSSLNPDLLAAYCTALGNAGAADKADALLWPRLTREARMSGVWIHVATNLPDCTQAEQWLDRLAAVVPHDHWEDRLRLAQAYDYLAQEKQSGSCAQKASNVYGELARDTDTPAGALLATATRAERRGDINAAAALYRRVIRIEPTQAIAHNNLAMILVKTGGDLEEAREHAAAAVKAQPRAATFRDTLARVRGVQHQYAEAAQAEQLAVQLDPENLVWRLRKTQFLLDLGDSENAANALREIEAAKLDVRPLSPEIRRELDELRKRVSGNRSSSKKPLAS